MADAVVGTVPCLSCGRLLRMVRPEGGEPTGKCCGRVYAVLPEGLIKVTRISEVARG